MNDIARQGITAAKWSTITTLARFGAQLLAQVILARVLGPDVYGVFGMGLVIFSISNFLATFGFSWSLAQLKDVSDEDIRFAFTWQMAVGLLAGIALYASAPWAADYFREPRVLSIVHWMSLTCIINAAGSVAGNLMRREMNFRASGLIQFGSYILGYICTGIPLALMGAGVTALVAAWMVQSIAVVVAGYWVRPHQIKPLLIGPQSRAMVRIGSAVFLTNIGNWFLNSIDRLMVGRFLNANAMGIYTAGSNLANMPNSLLIGALQPVFLAAGARVQDEPMRLRSAYMQVMATIWVLVLPLFVFLAAIAPDVIAFLYGPAWSDAAPVLAVMFLAMPGYVTWGMSTPVLWNTNRAHLELLLQLPLLPIAAFAFFLFASKGVVAAAMVASVLLLARGAIIAGAAFHVLKISFGIWLAWFARGSALSAMAAGLVLGATEFLPHGSIPFVRLIVSGGVVAVGMGALLLLAPNVLGAEVSSMLIRFIPQLKNRLKREGTS